MTDDQIKSLIDNEMRQSIGYSGGKMAQMRQKALYYYEGLAKGDLSPPEIEGRSSVVVTEVRNVIESMLPELMAKFGATDHVVEVEATRPEDEQNVKLISEYLNCIFYKKNNGHKIMETWFKDALLSKAGILKVYWDTRYEQTREEYKGLTDIEVAQLLDDDAIEGIEQKTYPDEEVQAQKDKAMAENPEMADQIAMMPVPNLTDITIKRTDKRGKLVIENVPPEEFMISGNAKDIQPASFVAHKLSRTASELKSMGYKNVDSLSGGDDSQQFDAEAVERNTFDDDMYPDIDSISADPAQRRITVTECYVRADRDGDGISELLKVVIAGNTILDIATVDMIPFVHIVPVILPHRFFGLSMADLAMEPQRIKTSILRAILDNAYLQVNGRYYVVEGKANLDDLMTSRPGGVVRMTEPGMAGRLDQGMGDSGVGMNIMEYLQSYTEESTGWHRAPDRGDNPNSLNKTATEANIQVNRAQMRTDLVARNFAEGITALFGIMLKLVCQHQDYVEDMRSDGRWVKVDPRMWRNKYDFTINVGLGTGSKDQQVQHLMMQLNVQKEALQIGLATPENLHNTAKKLSEALGFRNVEQFWSDPKTAPQAPPKPSPEEQKLQFEMQKHQMETQQRQQEQQQQAAIRQRELEMEAQKQQMQAQNDMQERQHKAELDAQLASQRLEYERWKAQLDSDTQIAVARMRLMNNGNNDGMDTDNGVA